LGAALVRRRGLFAKRCGSTSLIIRLALLTTDLGAFLPVPEANPERAVPEGLRTTSIASSFGIWVASYLAHFSATERL